jgi:hypothetical protein
MPFVDNKDGAREKLLKGEIFPRAVGDLCFVKAFQMYEEWKKDPRWTTAHNITKKTFDLNDEDTARLLAWMVWFCREVLKYEDIKAKENGDLL